MMFSKTRICSGWLLCLVLCSNVVDQDRSQQDAKSCKEFVEAFYASGVGWAVEHSPVPTLELALKSERSAFSADLFLQLSEDSESQKKAGSDIVGLDFDPFLACQDCPGRYDVAKTTIKDAVCWADVLGIWDEKENAGPKVTAELKRKDDRWVFANFHYPNPERPEFENLLSLLKSLREFRARRADAESKKR